MNVAASGQKRNKTEALVSMYHSSPSSTLQISNTAKTKAAPTRSTAASSVDAVAALVVAATWDEDVAVAVLTGLLLVVVGAIFGLEDVLEDAEVKLTAAIPIVWTVSQLLVGGAV